MLKKILIFIILLIVLFVGAAVYFTSKLNDEIGSEKIVEMPKNASVSLVVDIFNDNDMLEPGCLFTVWLKIYTMVYDDLRIHPGVYKFTADNTNLDVIKAVFSGQQRYVVKITYPEGITLGDFASITAKYLDIDSAEFVNYCNSPQTLKKYGIKAKTAEGYLFPDTYNFYFNATAEQVCDKLFKQQEKVWNEITVKHKNDLKLSKHEILTLASIIEAETPVAKERPVVAGLYLNRLRIGMKLDADPTVRYALKNKKKRLTYADLKIKSPYNTYLHTGLPPGPICSPGRTAIEAVFNRKKHNYLYFVAKGNGSREHYFTGSYSQHLNNRRRYKHNKKMN